MDFYIKFINVKKGNDPIAVNELIKKKNVENRQDMIAPTKD